MNKLYYILSKGLNTLHLEYYPRRTHEDISKSLLVTELGCTTLLSLTISEGSRLSGVKLFQRRPTAEHGLLSFFFLKITDEGLDIGGFFVAFYIGFLLKNIKKNPVLVLFLQREDYFFYEVTSIWLIFHVMLYISLRHFILKRELVLPFY